MFLVALLHFCFRKKALKVLNFQTFLSKKETFAATFSETCALFFRKDISEPGISIPNLLEKLQFFWSHSSIFALEKYPEYLNFNSFLPLRDALVASFNKRHAPTSRKYVDDQGMNILKSSEKHKLLLSHSSVFALQ